MTAKSSSRTAAAKLSGRAMALASRTLVPGASGTVPPAAFRTATPARSGQAKAGPAKP